MSELGVLSIFPAALEFLPVGIEAIEELKPLFRKEWEEVGEKRDVLELDIDFDILTLALTHGRALIEVAKRGIEIVGYAVYMIAHHPKYRRTLWAFGNGLWIDPSARAPRVSLRLIDAAEKELKARNVQFIQSGSRIAHKSAGRVYAAAGYEAYEIGWIKRIQ